MNAEFARWLEPTEFLDFEDGYRGEFDDLPFDEIMEALRANYGRLVTEPASRADEFSR